LAFGLIAIFFGILIAAVFELFRVVDYLLTPPWQLSPVAFCRVTAIILIGVILGQLTWRLAVALLGVLTPKYDPPPLKTAPLVLPASQQAALYHLVVEVCRQVSAPQPDEIRLSYAAACYVTEQREFAVRPRRRLTLVLGLPQLLVLSVQELKVIVAHEMAHFRCRDTTVVVFLFRFGESLRKVCDELQARAWRWADPIYWLFLAAHRLTVRVARPIQRQQELHADAISAAIYGGELAVQTLLKDWLLTNQFELAVHDYPTTLVNGQIAESVNVFQFFQDRWRNFSAAARGYLETRLAEEERDLPPDSRPTFQARFQRMREFPSQPLTESPPAVDLLSGLPVITTLLHQSLFAADAAGAAR
jgi:Zn-dependent protease with chaperone function